MTTNPFSDHDWLLDDEVTPVHADEQWFLCGSDRRSLHDADLLGSPAEVSHASRQRRERQALAAGAPEAGDLLPRFAPKRRSILRGAGAGLGALLAPTAAARYSFAATTTPRDTIVVIFLRGAIDTLSAVVPYADPAYYTARPGIAVPRTSVLDLDGRFGLHPQLAPLLPAWRAGQLAVVHATGSIDPTRSHFEAQAGTERAAPANVRTGWLGRHLEATSSSQGTFRALTVGARASASLAAKFPTLAMSTIADFNIYTPTATRTAVLRDLDGMFGDFGSRVATEAHGAFDALNRLATMRTTTYTPAAGAVYPVSTFGQNLAETARLIKAGLGVEVACLDVGNWDMHAYAGSATDPNAWMSRQLRDLGQGLAAFRADLGARFANTVVVTMSEFGRRVAQNGTSGTDHGHGQAMLVMGGGVHGGRVYGTWPGLGSGSLDQGDLAVTTDYRHALAEVVTHRLRNARTDLVFPGFTPAPLGVA